MPTYSVTDPNSGKVINLTGDSPPTEDELIQIFDSQQVKSGPRLAPGRSAKAQRIREKEGKESIGIVEAFTGEKRSTEEIEGLEEIGAAPELNQFSVPAFKTSIGLLATGDTESLKGIIKQQLPGAEFKEDEKGNTIVKLDSGEYALNKPGLSGQDLARAVFQFASFVPAGRAAAIPATATGRIAAGGAASAATEAGLQATAGQLGGGDIDFPEVALSGALGGGSQAVGELLSTGVRAATGTIPDSAQQAIDAGARLNVPVTTTDVIPPKNILGALSRQLGERIPVFGTGGKRASQQVARERVVQDFASKVEPFTSNDIVTSLKNKTSKIKKAAGNRLETTRNNLDQIGEIPKGNLINQIDNSLNNLKSVKISPDTKTIQQIEEIAKGAQQPHSFSQLRDARTAVRELAEASDPLGRSQLPSKSKAALKSIEKSITRDLDDFAKNNMSNADFQRYKKADLIYAQEASKLTKSRLKNILDKGDLTPETVETVLFSRKPSEVKLLYDSLGKTGRDAARSSLVQRALDKATRGDDISPTVFANQLDNLKKNTGIFFKGDDLKALNGLQKLLQSTKRAQEASVATPTGQSLLFVAAAGSGAQVGLIPTFLGAATGGSAARIYESAPVRNMLLRLSSTPINSTKFDKIIRDSLPAINAALQTIEGGK